MRRVFHAESGRYGLVSAISGEGPQKAMRCELILPDLGSADVAVSELTWLADEIWASLTRGSWQQEKWWSNPIYKGEVIVTDTLLWGSGAPSDWLSLDFQDLLGNLYSPMHFGPAAACILRGLTEYFGKPPEDICSVDVESARALRVMQIWSQEGPEAARSCDDRRFFGISDRARFEGALIKRAPFHRCRDDVEVSFGL